MKIAASIVNNPELDNWLKFSSNGVLTVFTGKVELGQKSRTDLRRKATLFSYDLIFKLYS